MLNFIMKLFKKYPLWCYGVQCSVCRMTFISPSAHLDHVLEKKTLHKHINKIPKL